MVLTLVSYFTCDCFTHNYIRRLVPYFPLKFFKFLVFFMVIRRLPNCIWVRYTCEYLIHIFIGLLHWFEVAVRRWKFGSWSLRFGRQTLKRRCDHGRNIYITHFCGAGLSCPRTSRYFAQQIQPRIPLKYIYRLSLSQFFVPPFDKNCSTTTANYSVTVVFLYTAAREN